MGAVSHFFFSSGSTPSATATRYSPIVGGQQTSNLSSSSSTVRVPLPVAGTIRTIGVSYTGVPMVSGQRFNICMIVNGSTIFNSTQTVLDDTTNHVVITPAVPISANDDVCLRWIPTGSPDITNMVVYSHIVFEASATDRVAIPGVATASSTTTALYLPLNHYRSMLGTISQIDSMMPCSGTINGFTVHSSTSTNTSSVYTTFTLYVNGVAQSMTAVHNDVSGTSPTVYSTGSPIHVSMNDTITIQRTGTGAIASQYAGYSLDFTPDTAGDYPLVGNSGTSQWGSTQTNYMSFAGGQTNSTVENANYTFIAEPFNFHYLQFWMSNTANSSGTTYRNITLRQNGASVGTNFNIANTGSAGTTGANVDFAYAVGDYADILQQPPAGGITVGNWKMGGVLKPVSSGTSTAGYMKTWNGTAWVAKPVKVWNGSAWVQKPLKRWDGTSWKLT